MRKHPVFFKIPAKSWIYTFYEGYKCNAATLFFYTSLAEQIILQLVVQKHAVF